MKNIPVYKKLRHENGLTQQQVADYLHMDRSTYAYYEIGQTKPTVEFLLALARLYGVSLSEMLGASPAEESQNRSGMLFSQLSRNEQKLIILCRSGTAVQREALLAKLEALAQ